MIQINLDLVDEVALFSGFAGGFNLSFSIKKVEFVDNFYIEIYGEQGEILKSCQLSKTISPFNTIYPSVEYSRQGALVTFA